MSEQAVADSTLVGLQGEWTAKEVHLIRAAYRVVGEKGVHRLSLQDIADVAAVSKGVILYHFKTKENLILTTMRWVLLRTAERIDAGLAGAVSPEEQIPAMIDAIFVDAEANRNFSIAYLDLVDEAARTHSFGKLSATFTGIVNSLYAEVIRRGAALGAFAVDDVDEAARVVRAIIDGLFVQWIQEDALETAHPRYRDVCKRAVLAYLGARASAPAVGAERSDGDGGPQPPVVGDQRHPQPPVVGDQRQ